MMVAEKPSIALSIADALSNGSFNISVCINNKKESIARSIPLYVYNGKFKG